MTLKRFLAGTIGVVMAASMFLGLPVVSGIAGSSADTAITASAATVADALAEKQTSAKNKGLLLNDKNPEATVGGYGCAFMSNYYMAVQTGAILPNTSVASFLTSLKKVNAFDTGGYMTWSAITKVCPSIKYQKTISLSGKSRTDAISTINTQLKNGYGCIVQVKTGYGNHYVYAYLQNGSMKIADSSFNYNGLTDTRYSSIVNVLIYTVAHDPTDELVDGGIYVIHPKDNKGTAISALGTEIKSNVALANLDNNNQSQQWRAVKKGEYFYFINVKSGLCLDVAAQKVGNVSNGTNIHLYTKSDGYDQVQLYAAKLEPNNGNSYYTLTLYNTNYSINVYGNSSAVGSNITTWEKSGDLTQQWVLKKVNCTNHNWVETSRVNATCEADGSVTYTCKNCGATKTETLAKLGHDWVETIIEPTCEEDGSITYTCKNGGETRTETIPKLGHEWFETERGNGYILYTCEHCGETYKEIIEPTIRIKAQPGDKSVKLNWNAVEGAEGYAVYECIDDMWQPVGKTNDTTYVYNGLENGKNYTVSVIAKINGNWQTDFSNAVTVTPIPPYPVVSYEVSGRQFRLKWTAVSGAEKYGIAVYQSGGWKVKVQTDKTTYTSPKMSKGAKAPTKWQYVLR